MNKKEFIDDFINRQRGIPNATKFSISGHQFSVAYFQKRASELGWINGYRWGEEYSSPHGKKPNLMDDVRIHVNLDDNVEGMGGWVTYNDITVGNRNWESNNIISFKIVDERYKPTKEKYELEQWVLYDSLPPVNTVCEIKPYWHTVEIVAHHNGDAVYYDMHEREYRSCGAPEFFRRKKTEKELLIEKTSVITHRWQIDGSNSLFDLAERLYDAGLLNTKTGEN